MINNKAVKFIQYIHARTIKEALPTRTGVELKSGRTGYYKKAYIFLGRKKRTSG